MKVEKSALSGAGVSLVVHVVLLAALSTLTYVVGGDKVEMAVDSVFSDERPQEEFTQTIDTTTEVAETLNVISGGAVSGGIGGQGGTGGEGVAAAKIAGAESLKEPTIKAPGIGAIAMPGIGTIGDDLGAGEVTGDIGRAVEGYGAALGQFTQELIRMMRQEKVLVCWLFDESESMKDDQKLIRENFHKVYEELGIAAKQDRKLKLSDEILLTSVMSFGAGISEHTQKPTSNIPDIRAAIDKIGIDETGKENMCQSISAAVGKYIRLAQGQKRKLIIVVVSDESGDDGSLVEETIDRCKRADVPIYVFGRYSVFGFPYARWRWVDPKYGLTFWRDINRGPETPYPELLQFDGIHVRQEYDSAGFGPYDQVRLVRETGGIFFMLPGTDDNIEVYNSVEQRAYDLLDMKEYLPSLEARALYAKERDTSPFRFAQWEVINLLNPYKDPQLNMQRWGYPTDPQEFAATGKANFDKAIRAMSLLNQAVARLDQVRPLRAKEDSRRWRANYDLIYAQCLAFRVRLFQFLLALDKHQKDRPQIKGKAGNGDPHNKWDLTTTKEMLKPDAQQIAVTKVDIEELEKQLAKAHDGFKAIIAEHPRTPWALRAQRDMDAGYGMTFVEGYWDPRYAQAAVDVKVPNP